jgi:CubicO group peptidase (beta-lactamase class C family)
MFQMLAIGRGQIDSLDDPLAKYCTGFSMMTEYNITLRQMAAQVSV